MLQIKLNDLISWHFKYRGKNVVLILQLIQKNESLLKFVLAIHISSEFKKKNVIHTMFTGICYASHQMQIK